MSGELATSGSVPVEDGGIVAPFRAGTPEKTKKRTLTRRGVMWLGQTCNLRCYFCYFLNRIEDHSHIEHPFMSIEKTKEMCHTMRYFYGNTAIDIQGGEPTIYPDIHELVSYCRDIGLHPTLITNGLVLEKMEKLQKLKDAGVRDFLVSFHGIGDVHDEVVCRKGAYVKMHKAVQNMAEIGMPFRFNCTMSKPVVPLLPDIARKAVEYGAGAVNYIAFNPFEDQETGIRTHDNVAKYGDIMKSLGEAMDILEEAGIECNVRYLPLCMAEEKHRKNFYNLQQLSYDHHEWDYSSWFWTGAQPQRIKSGSLNVPYRIGRAARRLHLMDPHELLENFEKRPVRWKFLYMMQGIGARLGNVVLGKKYWYNREGKNRAAHDLQYKHHESCQKCSLRNICDGFHGDYANFHGVDEAEPITNIPPMNDPCYYIDRQDKLVEEEDRSWAL